MRHSKLLSLSAVLLAVTACVDDDGVSVDRTPEPAALVRFINAVPDTGTVDLRFIDMVENLPTLQGVAFRGSSGFYQRVTPGSRAARIFPNSTDPVLTQVRLVDTTVPLAPDTRYTLVYAGRARAGSPATEQHRLVALEDPRTPPTPPAGSIAFQALHVAVGIGSVDVHIVPVATATAPLPADWQAIAVGKLSNVPYLGRATAYVNVPVRPTTGLPMYRFVVTAAGSVTPLFTGTPNQPGATAPAGSSYGPQPGVQIAGSVMTAVIASGSTPGTRQSTTANQTPTVVLISDKVLNPS